MIHVSEGGIKIYESKSKTFSAFCFFFIAGIAAASALSENGVSDFFLYFCAILGVIFLLVVFWQDQKRRWLFGCLLFFVLGYSRYLLFWSEFAVFEDEKFSNQTVIFEGTVARDADVRLDETRYEIKLKKLDFNPAKGKILVAHPLYPRFGFGDYLRGECVLKKPEPIVGPEGEIFHYEKFLAKEKISAYCFTREMEKIADGGGFFAGLFRAKSAVAEKIGKLWLEPRASFMAGILYGYRGGLGEAAEDFSKAGLSHLVAVSGYNITIIATVLLNFFVFFRIKRQKSFWLVVFLLALFVLFTGASPSVTRAAVMGIVGLFARQVGRTSKPGNLLLLAAVIMVAVNPLVLFWDIGFQLSFAATWGLIYISPILKIKWEKNLKIEFGKETILSTLSASISTWPFIAYYFGYASLVSLPANLVVLWIVPFLMLFGALAVFASFVFEPAGFLLANLIDSGLAFVLGSADFFASWRFSVVEINFALPALILTSFFTVYLFQIRPNLKSFKIWRDR